MGTEESRFNTQQRPSFLCHNTQIGTLVYVVSRLKGKLTRCWPVSHLCQVRKINKKWSYTSILTYIMTWCFVMQCNQFNLSLPTAASVSCTVRWMAKWQWRIETSVRASGRIHFQGTFPAFDWWNRKEANKHPPSPESMAGLDTERVQNPSITAQKL